MGVNLHVEVTGSPRPAKQVPSFLCSCLQEEKLVSTQKLQACHKVTRLKLETKQEPLLSFKIPFVIECNFLKSVPFLLEHVPSICTL